MADRFRLFLDSEIYFPGQTINGRVECSFNNTVKVRGIYVKFKSEARTYWKEDDDTYSEQEKYFKTKINLLEGDAIVIPTGKSTYTFTFVLPVNIPSSIKRRYGSVKYFAQAVIDLPWQINFMDKSKFTVGTYLDLNTCESLKSPLIKTECKELTSFVSDKKSIIFSVKLPVSGYAISEVINFSTIIKNKSSIQTAGLKFKIVQIFQYRAKRRTKREEIVLLKSFTVKDSSVASESEKMWNLQLQLPSDLLIPNLEGCNIIKMFCELRGKVLLPFPHFDIRLTAPFSIGHVPLEKTTAFVNDFYKDKSIAIGWNVP